jgi:formamidopyrimidine-DNA glycosylase
MAELPEVHTITEDLNKEIPGYTIQDVTVIGNYRINPDKIGFINKLKGQAVVKAERVAKNILIKLGSGEYILIHLAMTGQVLLKELRDKTPNWARVVLRITKNGATKTIYLCDMRMFGKIEILSENDIGKLRSKYGPEPITEHLTPENFHQQVTSKNTNIKNVLLDQSIVSGLGNIYTTDALFIAGIHPETPARQLTVDMARKLLDASREILNEGIKHRGSTLQDKMYIDIYGKEGTHQKYFRIYGKNVCPVCSSKIIYKKVSGRGTYFCANCQSLNGQKTLF